MIRITVDTEEQKQELLQAIYHIHGSDINTDIPMVNELVHLYHNPDLISVLNPYKEPKGANVTELDNHKGNTMNIDLIKTSHTEGAVFVKYKLHKRHPFSPEYNITLPFRVKDDDMVEFKITQEALGDLVNLIKRNFE